MAAPPPYWKKKTRPCPFYSQGRCLFSDACNFVHTVKVNNNYHPVHESTGVTHLDADDAEMHGDRASYKTRDDNVFDPARFETVKVPSPAPGPRSSCNSLNRTPSEKRRRVVLMSPSRSPRLSGLLSALEDVIGPDLEEVEVTDEEGDDDDERGVPEQPELVDEDGLEGALINEERPTSIIEYSHSQDEGDVPERPEPANVDNSNSEERPASISEPSPYTGSTLLAYCQDSPSSLPGEQRPLREHSESSPPLPVQAPPSNDVQQVRAGAVTSATASPLRSPLRSTRILSPIVIHRLDREHITMSRDDDSNTLEVYSHSTSDSDYQQQNQLRHHYHHHTHTEHTEHVSQQQQQNHHADNNNNPLLTPSRGSRPQSTFELLASPFAHHYHTPTHQILSPQLFAVRLPNSPVFGGGFQPPHPHLSTENGSSGKRRYADDDMDSLETLELDRGERENVQQSTSSGASTDRGTDESPSHSSSSSDRSARKTSESSLSVGDDCIQEARMEETVVEGINDNFADELRSSPLDPSYTTQLALESESEDETPRSGEPSSLAVGPPEEASAEITDAEIASGGSQPWPSSSALAHQSSNDVALNGVDEGLLTTSERIEQTSAERTGTKSAIRGKSSDSQRRTLPSSPTYQFGNEDASNGVIGGSLTSEDGHALSVETPSDPLLSYYQDSPSGISDKEPSYGGPSSFQPPHPLDGSAVPTNAEPSSTNSPPGPPLPSCSPCPFPVTLQQINCEPDTIEQDDSSRLEDYRLSQLDSGHRTERNNPREHNHADGPSSCPSRHFSAAELLSSPLALAPSSSSTPSPVNQAVYPQSSAKHDATFTIANASPDPARSPAESEVDATGLHVHDEVDSLEMAETYKKENLQENTAEIRSSSSYVSPAPAPRPTHIAPVPSPEKGGEASEASCSVHYAAASSTTSTSSSESFAISLAAVLQVPVVQTESSETGERESVEEWHPGHWSPSNANSSSVLDDLMAALSSPGDGNSDKGDSSEGQLDRAGATRILRDSAAYLAPLSTSQLRGDVVDTPTTLSFEPSPITPVHRSSHTPEPLVMSETDDEKSLHRSILERRAMQLSGSPKRLTVVSLTSPTNDLRDSFSPSVSLSSVEKTVRPTPLPLYQSPRHSASDSAASSALSSPRPSWAELQRRSGTSNKVPFGFRQSLLAEEPSLSQKLASQFSSESSVLRNSSISSLSPTSAFNPRRASRVDVLAGRARSVSPAFAGFGPSSYRHSMGSGSGSASYLQTRPPDNIPRSASQIEFFHEHPRSDSPIQVGDPGPSSRRASWMKPLRLSQVYSPSSVHSRSSFSLSKVNRLSTVSTHSSQSNVQNTSRGSSVQTMESSSARSSLISAYLNDSYIPTHDDATITAATGTVIPSVESVFAAADSINGTREETVYQPHTQSKEKITNQEGSPNIDLLSPLSGSMRGLCFDELAKFQWTESTRNSVDRSVTVTDDVPPDVVRSAPLNDTPTSSTSAMLSCANTPILAPPHAVAMPRPDLMFAIASDDPAEVERVLASGTAQPNDVIGPQSALEFAMTNNALVNKTEIVKTLLAFGADPSVLPSELRDAREERENKGEEEEEEEHDVLADLPSENPGASFSKRRKRDSALNPAIQYYLKRASSGFNAVQTSVALKRSDFRPLARMRFDFVGQDRALEHLYWVLGMHSQQPIGTPLVVLCCGPNGHGKSLLARKFGSLLDVPTHTVNMTVLKTSHDLWDCPSMSPYDPPSDRTLAEFLEANAGKRCVVVLDEIDKNEDERTLWSLLAPWELGRCSIDAGRQHIDVRNVIWLGTSNLGQDLVLEHHSKRNDADTVMSKAEYRDLMNILRPLVSGKLGTSLMSRVTAVLPFVPFTHEEKLAIASEAIFTLGGEGASELSPEEFERLALQCLSEYIESDGARSLYRSVSTHLMEAF